MAYKTNLSVLNGKKPLELVLRLNSFSGGENTIGEDQALKNNESRNIENWQVESLGGMERATGFTQVAAKVSVTSDALDLVVQHKESTSTKVYGIVDGDLVSGTGLAVEDVGAFTSGKLCSAVSAGDKLWITNATDNLKYKTIAGAITIPSDVPTVASPRIYEHKFRLIAEGSGKVVYGSKAGTGNWVDADAWSLANDAWNITIPDITTGGVPNFPSGQEFSVFTEFGVYSISNFPNVTYRPIANAHGCENAYSIANGNEGVFFVSKYPTLGIYLWDRVNFINLTEFNDFVDKIDFTARMYGEYRNNKYYFFYVETGTGATEPNRLRIYNTKFGRWSQRPVNSELDDNLGYPALLKYSNNELYSGSSNKTIIYELESGTSDAGVDTIATLKTKDFSSRDFELANGAGVFPIDEVRMKLTKMTITFFGISDVITVQWQADRGLHSGNQTVEIDAAGDKLNTTFTVNTSKVVQLPPDTTRTVSFNNSAVGRRFNFQINTTGSGTLPRIKNIKIHALAIEED